MSAESDLPVPAWLSSNALPRYTHPLVDDATHIYVDLARNHGLDPSQMALAYLLEQPFVASVIVGATTLEQLALLQRRMVSNGWCLRVASAGSDKDTLYKP